MSLLLGRRRVGGAARRRARPAGAPRRWAAARSSSPCSLARSRYRATRRCSRARAAAVRTTARCCASIRSIRGTSARDAAAQVTAASCTTASVRTGTSSGSPSACCTPRCSARCSRMSECIDARGEPARRAMPSRYLDYPNRDNVLGPSRPFFSTYLESIWLLQLVLALDLLETAAPTPAISALGSRVARPTSIEPSARTHRVVRRRDVQPSGVERRGAARRRYAARPTALVDHAIEGARGCMRCSAQRLLADGSWYEGENYHLFAHRGLWYGVHDGGTCWPHLSAPTWRTALTKGSRRRSARCCPT